MDKLRLPATHWRPKVPPQSFVYSPLEASNEIRLLWLGPGRKTDPLCCYLNTINLDTDLQSIEYEALSYTWGEMREGYTLHEREGDISITPNLHSALTALRPQDGFIVLWIDAVCINQQDNSEKAAQILLMRRIFQTSARVIAWFGEQYENSHLVEDLLFKIEEVDLDSDGIEWFSDQMLVNLGLPPDDDQSWEAFRALIRRPWFRRVWIIQEIVVAKDLVFKCGDWMVDWTVFTQAFTKMRTHNLFRLEVSPNDETKEATERGAFSLRRLLSLRCSFISNEFGMDKLRDLLMLCRDFQSTFARDHLFALLGIAPDGDNPAFAPDYEKSSDDIVKQYARTFILRDQAIDLLYIAGQHGQTRFPSWIPDWTRVRGPRDPLGFSYVPSDDSRWEHYHAAGVSAKLRFDEDPDTLIVRGALVDVVVQIGKDFSLGNERPEGVPAEIHFLSEYMSDIAAIIRSMDSYPTGENLLDVEWRTLICNLAKDNDEPNEEQLREAYIATRRWSKIMVDLTSSLQAVPPSDAMETFRTAQPFITSMTYKLKGRRFCVTRKGYIGLLPMETKTGDEIAIFDGATVPFVLRQAEKGDVAFYLIGECYVHGIMRGEALNKETEPRDISLI